MPLLNMYMFLVEYNSSLFFLKKCDVCFDLSAYLLKLRIDSSICDLIITYLFDIIRRLFKVGVFE